MYQNESLYSKYKRAELWLRSDMSRLMELFKVAVPTSVALEKAQKEIKELKHEVEK